MRSRWLSRLMDLAGAPRRVMDPDWLFVGGRPVRMGASLVGMRPGDLYVLSLSHLTDDVYQGALPAMLPFLVSDRGVSVAAASMLVFVANLTSSLGQPYYGRLADRGQGWGLAALGLALA